MWRLHKTKDKTIFPQGYIMMIHRAKSKAIRQNHLINNSNKMIGLMNKNRRGLKHWTLNLWILKN